ncbi:hypothetical protein BT63DRAFT_417795 [Microthyrium microscopicum]|uniref:Uncharacterized protein n=1 Tax=Microthyrium microscopicum TaxID=703497 RepID=A0A6A6TWJ3_9PEZI|nr:hypothetical protein BT63DRAFT_417795 [Microthyrium microscopicum]
MSLEPSTSGKHRAKEWSFSKESSPSSEPACQVRFNDPDLAESLFKLLLNDGYCAKISVPETSTPQNLPHLHPPCNCSDPVDWSDDNDAEGPEANKVGYAELKVALQQRGESFYRYLLPQLAYYYDSFKPQEGDFHTYGALFEHDRKSLVELAEHLRSGEENPKTLARVVKRYQYFLMNSMISMQLGPLWAALAYRISLRLENRIVGLRKFGIENPAMEAWWELCSDVWDSGDETMKAYSDVANQTRRKYPSIQLDLLRAGLSVKDLYIAYHRALASVTLEQVHTPSHLVINKLNLPSRTYKIIYDAVHMFSATEEWDDISTKIRNIASLLGLDATGDMNKDLDLIANFVSTGKSASEQEVKKEPTEQ